MFFGLKKKLFVILPVVLALTVVAIAGFRLQNENRVFRDISLLYQVFQYAAVYEDEEALFSFIFIESDNRVKNHIEDNEDIILISKDNSEYLTENLSVYTIKSSTLFSPYSIIRISGSLELNSETSQLLQFDELRIGDTHYDIGTLIFERIPALGERNIGIGATMFFTRNDLLELLIANDEVSDLEIVGVVFYLSDKEINLLDAPILLESGEQLEKLFDMSYFSDSNLSIAFRVDMMLEGIAISMRIPSAIEFIDEISKEEIIAKIGGVAG